MTLTFRKILAAVIVALLTLTGVAVMADNHGDKVSKITAKGDKCVEPTDVMRRNHMEFILHQRDDTMRRGVRVADIAPTLVALLLGSPEFQRQ